MPCGCGCGKEAGVYAVRGAGYRKGGPRKFLIGHNVAKKTTHCKRGHEKTPDNCTPRGVCKLCNRMRGTKWHREHPERRLEIARKCAYKITEDTYQGLLIEQQHKCCICKAAFIDGKGNKHKHATCIDHDHACCAGQKSCGKCIRGLICRGCNMMLGSANDNIQTLRNAIQYLENSEKCQPNIYSELRATAHIRLGLENPSSPELRCSATAATA